MLALEPNNLVPNLMFDRYGETDYNVEGMLDVLEVKLRIEKGKKRLGEGFNSLGDVVPDLFVKAGVPIRQALREAGYRDEEPRPSRFGP